MATARKPRAKVGGQTYEAAAGKISELSERFGSCAVPLEELWERLDKELGSKTLTGEL